MRGISLAFVFALTACNAGPELSIFQNQRPLATCAVPSEPTEPITHGTFDLAIGDRSSYLLTPLVQNHTGESVTVQIARVRLTWSVDGVQQPVSIRCDGGAVCSEWELDACAELASCPVVPANGVTSFPVQILPRVLTAYFREQADAAVAAGRVPPDFEVTSTVTLEGTTSSGILVVGEPFTMPVRVCLGCLVSFPAGSDSPAIAGPDCCGGVEPVPACFLGQDGPIDCHHCVRTLPEICNFGRLSCG